MGESVELERDRAVGDNRGSHAFGRVRASAFAARRFIEDFFSASGGTVDPAVMLLANELIINAILHSSGREFDLEVSYVEGRVRVAVSDDTRPLLDSPLPEWQLGGRGLLLVDRLAERWGVEHPTGTGKCVWFELEKQIPSLTS